MFSAILYWLLELGLSWLLPGRAWPVPFMIGDRFEQFVNGTPMMQGRVVAVVAALKTTRAHGVAFP
jgi:hypothetical protein